MKKKIIFLSIFILILLIGGAGIYYYTQSHRDAITYADTEAKYKTYTEEAPTDGSIPTDHDAYENIAYVLWVLEHTQYYSSLTTGSATSVGQKQEIYNHRRVNGDEQLVDTVSSGVVPVGYQKYFSGGKVLLRKFVSKNGNDITWSDDEPECITYKGYIGRYGWLPSQATAYIICKETILEISDVTILENGLYSIKLTLNPDDDYGPFWYRREIATNSSSLTKVVFSSISIEYVFDDDWVVQYVNTQEKYNVTPRVAPITVDCVTDLVEIFDYKNYSFDKNAMNYFDKYADMTPSDGELEPNDEMSPLSYITGSLMSGNNEKTFDLKINLNGQTLNGKLALDIADLNNIKVKVAIGELQVVYTDETIYIEFNKNKVKGKIADLSTLIAPLLGSEEQKSNASESSFDVAAILSDIDSAIVSETDDRVTLDLTLHLLGIELPLNFEIAKLSNDYDLLAINSQINYNGIVADVSVIKNENITFNPLTDDYQELTDLSFIIEDIATIMQNKVVQVEFNGSYEEIDVQGLIVIDFNSSLVSKLILNLVDNKLGINEEVELIFESEIIYLSYGNVNVKVPLSLLSFISDVDFDLNTDLSSLDVNEIINTILNIDFKAILEKISITEDNVEIVTNLSQFFDNLETIRLVISNTNNGFDVSVNYFDLYLNVIVNDIEPINIDYAKYGDVLKLVDFVEDILTIISNEHVNIGFSANISNTFLTGTAYIDFSDGIKARVELNIQYAEINETLIINYLNDNIYVDYRNLKLEVSKEELINLIKEYVDFSSDINIDELLFDILNYGLKNIIDELVISEDKIDLVLSLGELLLSLELIDTEVGFDVNLNVSDYSFNLIVDTITTFEFNLDSNEYSNVSGYISFGKYIKELVDNGSIEIILSGKMTTYQISFEGKIDLVLSGKSYDAVGNFTIACHDKEVEVTIYYQAKNLYLSLYGQTLKLNVETINDTLNEILKTLGITMPNLDFDITLDSILDIINSLVVTDNSVSINLSNIIELLDVVKLTFGSSLGEVKLEAGNLFVLDLLLESSSIMNVDVPTENIIDEQAILELVDYVKDVLTIIENKHVNIKFAANIDKLELSGDVYIDFNSTLKCKLDLNVKYADIEESITIYYFDGNIYIDYRNVKLKLIDEELINLLNEFIVPSKDFDLSELIDKLLTLDFNNLINSLVIGKDCFDLVLSLDELLLSLKLIDTEIGFDINLNVLDYELILMLDIESIYEFDLNLSEYVDSSQMLESIKFLLNLINKESILITIPEDSKATVNFVLNAKEESISLYGTVDLVYGVNGYSIEANLLVEGLGIITDLRVILDNNVVYLTISNQTIVVDLDDLDSFVDEVLTKLSPIISFEDEVETYDLNNTLSLGFLDSLIIGSNSFEITIEDILEDVLKLSLVYSYVVDNQKLVFDLNGNYGDISFSLNDIALTKSSTVALDLPTENLITKDEMLTAIDYVVAFYDLVRQKEFNLSLVTDIITNGNMVADISLELYLKLLDNNEFDARIKLFVNEYADGVKTAWHQLDLSIISLSSLLLIDPTQTDALMFGIYGNNEKDQTAVVKVKSTYKGITNLIEEVMNLLNLDVIGQLTSGSGSSQAFDISNLIAYLNISESSLSLGLNGSSLYPAMLDENQVVSVKLTKFNDKIKGLEANNLIVNYTNIYSSMKLDNLAVNILDSGLNIELPASFNGYYDISNLSYIVEALYNNAMEKNFEITGNVAIKALSIIDIKVPVTIKVNVEDSGEPTMFIHLDMSNINALATLMLSRKHVYIYYKNQYVYIERDDSNNKDDRKIKIHYTTFMDNIVYYLMDFAMGMPNSIIDLINNSDTKGDGFVDASGCVTQVELGTNTFTFGLDMKELVDNGNLGDLLVTLTSTMVAKTNDDGSYVLDDNGEIVFVPMIYKLTKFSFDMVNVIELHSEDLVLSNIVKDSNGNFIVKDVDFSSVYAYTEDFDANFNADEEYIYDTSLKKFVSNGKIKHKVVFDLGAAGSVVNQLYMDSKIDFPTYANNIIRVDNEGVVKYYQLLGWYYDTSYLNPIEDLDNIYMSNSKQYYYGRVVDVTVQLEITSMFGEVTYITTYVGANISDIITENYNIRNLDGQIYKFIKLTLNGEEYDMTNVIAGDYNLVAEFEIVYYDFYAIYGDNIYLLLESDTSSFLGEDVVILKDGIYYLYDLNILTPQFIMTRFANLFVVNDELFRFEIILLSKDLMTEYDLITFSVDSDYNNKDYKGFYILKNQTNDVSGLLPNGTSELFEINAWKYATSSYFSLFDLEGISGSYHLEGYVSSKQESFTFERTTNGASISSYDGTSQVVIFPVYAKVGSDYLLLTGLVDHNNGEVYSAFTANSIVTTVVINDGFMAIGNNAFKNCFSLKNVYIPSSVQSIASDAFFFSEGNGTLSGNKYADNLKLHFLYNESEAETFDYKKNKLVAYKRSLLGNYYYGDSSTVKNCAVKEKLSCLDVINSLI